jgi:hypothetical protein
MLEVLEAIFAILTPLLLIAFIVNSIMHHRHLRRLKQLLAADGRCTRCATPLDASGRCPNCYARK